MIIRKPPRPETAYTELPNAWLRDERLSRRARGLLAELMSHQDGWETSIEELSSNRKGPEGRDAINGAIKELKRCGYVRSERVNLGGGRFDAYLTIQVPSPSTDLPYTAQPSTVQPSTANPHAYKNPTPKKTNDQKTTGQKTTEPPRSRAASGKQLSYLDALVHQLSLAGELDEELAALDTGSLTADAADSHIQTAKGELHRIRHREGDEALRLGEAFPELEAELATASRSAWKEQL